MSDKLDNKLGRRRRGLVWLVPLDTFAGMKKGAAVAWVKARQAEGEWVATLVLLGMGGPETHVLSKLNLVSTAHYDDTISKHIPRSFPHATHGIAVGGTPEHDKHFRRVLRHLPAEHPIQWKVWTKQGMDEVEGQVERWEAPPPAPPPPPLGSAMPPGKVAPQPPPLKAKAKVKVDKPQNPEPEVDVLDMLDGKVEPKKKAGKHKNYTIEILGGVPSITCHACKRTSYSEGDVKDRYCGFCHKFHEGKPRE